MPGARVDQPAAHRFGFEDLPALILQRGADKTADLRLVFDQQGNRRGLRHAVPSDASSSGGEGGIPSGSVNAIDAPPSGDVPARIVPPCASTIARQMAN